MLKSLPRLKDKIAAKAEVKDKKKDLKAKVKDKKKDLKAKK